MKVKQLIAELEECMNEEAEVVLMSQPDRYPLYYHFRSVVDNQEIGTKCFIVLEEGSQIGYPLATGNGGAR